MDLQFADVSAVPMIGAHFAAGNPGGIVDLSAGAQFTITVVIGPAPCGSACEGALSATGGEFPFALVLLSAVLVAVGTAVAAWGRRRRHRGASIR